MFSLMPDDTKGLAKSYFCNSELCKEAATVAKLRGEKVKIKKQSVSG